MRDPDPPATRATERARLAMARLTTADSGNLADVFRSVCAISAETLLVERVGIWFLVEGASALRCANLFERSRGEHSEGVTLRVGEFPNYFAALRAMKAVPIALAAVDARGSELYEPYLQPLGITSLLDAPLWQQGRVIGVVCHEHVGPPRDWTTEEIDFAGSVADLVALKLGGAEISELRATLRTHEARQRAAEKAEAMSQLAVGVAHDFRNLLTVINGNANLIAGNADDAPGVAAWANQIAAAAERGAVLVRELLDFGRSNGAVPKVVDPAAVAEKFLPVLTAVAGARHRLMFDRDGSLGKILFDPNHFDRILLNLIANARDAMPDGGPIQMRIAPVQTAEVEGDPAKPHMLLEVRDGGLGMDAATQRRAFEPFFTTKPKGTGMGLAIVQRMAEKAGGFVRLTSSPNAGTTVQVLLPRVVSL